MAVRLTKAWSPAGGVPIARLPGQMGVYELADQEQRVLLIGEASGRSRFGLRGEIERALRDAPQARYYRYEVTTAYRTRLIELLMAHVADHGVVPPLNEGRDMPSLGRLSPV